MDFKSNSQQKLIHLREILLGRTKKQKRIDKPSYIGKKMIFIHICLSIEF